MKKRRIILSPGARTIKTIAAVVISMLIVDAYGTTSSKLIFAMLGAMAAMEPTFKESVSACLTQIVGVMIGGLAGVLFRLLPLPAMVSVAVGILLVITLYNVFQIPFSPSLPCFVVVMVCTTPDVAPLEYAAGRIWDSAIGLGVGLAINMLILPYDNSKKIRSGVKSLEKGVITFLEEFYDGENLQQDMDKLTRMVADIERQLGVFSNQRLFYRMNSQKAQLEAFRKCENMAHLLVNHMEVLCRMENVGLPDSETIEMMEAAGAKVVFSVPAEDDAASNAVATYHVQQILSLRNQLLCSLGESSCELKSE